VHRPLLRSSFPCPSVLPPSIPLFVAFSPASLFDTKDVNGISHSPPGCFETKRLRHSLNSSPPFHRSPFLPGSVSFDCKLIPPAKGRFFPLAASESYYPPFILSISPLVSFFLFAWVFSIFQELRNLLVGASLIHNPPFSYTCWPPPAPPVRCGWTLPVPARESSQGRHFIPRPRASTILAVLNLNSRLLVETKFIPHSSPNLLPGCHPAAPLMFSFTTGTWSPGQGS